MAMVAAFLPKGYSRKTKERFIDALGDVECIGFDMSREYEHVYLHEFDPTHCDDTLRGTKYLVIYTGAGKSAASKQRVTELFRQKCDEVFGPGETPHAVVVFEEHTNWMISVEGEMRCEDPEAVAQQRAYQEQESGGESI